MTSGIQDSTFAEKNITYDVAGNIQTLNRVYNGSLIDSLTYSYNGTNQLNSLTDASLYVGSNPGFDGYPYGTYAYSYDGNGNMTYDASKSLATSYNILNLPNNAFHDEYIYDANGVKLARLGKGSRPVYDDGLQRDLGASILQTEDGRAVAGRDGRYTFQYYLTDHLGDTRVVFDNPGDTLTVEQRDDYMPFGMDISVVNNAGNNYLYNRKELQNDTWLYDYGARFYDPVVGRWTTVDQHAEKYSLLSPYNYVYDDPLKNIDPDGKDGVKIVDKENRIITVKATYYVQSEAFKGGVIPPLYSNQQIQTLNRISTDLNKASYTVTEGDYKGYTVKFDLEFKKGGTTSEISDKAGAEQYNGIPIGNTFQNGNADLFPRFLLLKR